MADCKTTNSEREKIEQASILRAFSTSEEGKSRDNMAITNAWRKRVAVSTDVSQNVGENSVESLSEDSCVTSTPKDETLKTGTGLDSLPVAVLVRIICYFSHHELQPLARVSTRFREAVRVARQIHFDFKTPIRGKAPKRGSNASILNAPKKAGKFNKKRLSAKDIEELQNCTRQAKMMIEGL